VERDEPRDRREGEPHRVGRQRQATRENYLEQSPCSRGRRQGRRRAGEVARMWRWDGLARRAFDGSPAQQLGASEQGAPQITSWHRGDSELAGRGPRSPPRLVTGAEGGIGHVGDSPPPPPPPPPRPGTAQQGELERSAGPIVWRISCARAAHGPRRSETTRSDRSSQASWDRNELVETYTHSAATRHLPVSSSP